MTDKIGEGARLCAPTRHLTEARAMQYDPERHHRHTVRLPDFDYQQEGAYFITLCAYQRETLFGEIVDDDMILNTYGHIVLDEWMEMAIIRPSIFLDECIVMPNHFHAILFLPHIVDAHDVVGAHCRAPSARGINSIANATIPRFPHRRIQIHCDQTDQHTSCKPRHTRLAAQLPRTRRPRRGGITADSRVH